MTSLLERLARVPPEVRAYLTHEARGFYLDHAISLRVVSPSWRALFMPDTLAGGFCGISHWSRRDFAHYTRLRPRDRVSEAAEAYVRASRALGSWVAGPP